MRSNLLASAGFALGLLATARVASACGMHAPDSISTMPGLGLYRPDMLLLLPILAGTIERPIYSRAGYRDGALAYSIQANLLAGLAANTLGGVAFVGLYRSPAAGFLILLAPVVAVLVKLAWFARVPREAAVDAPRVGWFVLATLLSTVAIALTPFWMTVFGTDTQRYAASVADVRPAAILAVALAAIATHATLFARVRRVKPATRAPRGFDVMVVDDATRSLPPGQLQLHL